MILIFVKKNLLQTINFIFEIINANPKLNGKNIFYSFSLFFANLNAQNIPMTFHNGSFKSIPLIIPGLMNPNLSPKSNSGISLDVGQKVYFFPNGKKKNRVLLFIVNATFNKDTILQMDEIIEKRKNQLLEK